jgi:hypothetical protein
MDPSLVSKSHGAGKARYRYDIAHACTLMVRFLKPSDPSPQYPHPRYSLLAKFAKVVVCFDEFGDRVCHVHLDLQLHEIHERVELRITGMLG